MDVFNTLMMVEDTDNILCLQPTQLSSQHKVEDQYSSHSIPIDSERLNGATTIGMCMIA
jgi:hypothetical protein